MRANAITYTVRMRLLRYFFVALAILVSVPRSASADEQAPELASGVPLFDSEVERMEGLHRDSLRTRRLLADAVLIGGLVSLAGGGLLMVPDAADNAYRFAGVNTIVFGGINTVVGLLALHGIGVEESSWEAEGARVARRTAGGLLRARIHAVQDERRESVSHAINLGLGCAYLGVAATAALASQLGVDHPNRWLASSAAIGAQALYLVAIDFIGLTRSGRYHTAYLEGFAPSLAVTHSASRTDTHVGLGGQF